MKNINTILDEIKMRIAHLQSMETEYKKHNNISGRLNAKTRRQELQSLLNMICEDFTENKPQREMSVHYDYENEGRENH